MHAQGGRDITLRTYAIIRNFVAGSQTATPPKPCSGSWCCARVYILGNWGEPERAPHRRVCCGISLYIYLVRRAISHFRLLFCAFLCHSLIQKLFTNYSYSTQREDTNCLATARTETTRGPTYSMAGTIGATAWQKGFICRCHYLCCHSQWKSLVTWTDLSDGHIDECTHAC